MPKLDGAAILSIWERGAAQSLGERALTILALNATAPEDARAMSVGTRDAELLRVRRLLFGDRIEAMTACEACGEELDVLLSVEELLRGAPAPVVDEVFADANGRLVRFRIPGAGDLAALRGVDDVEFGLALLADRCLSSTDGEGAPVSLEDLSPEIVAALEDQLAAADPGAEMRLVSTCPACGAQNDALFDVPSYLWKEMHRLANDVLWDVHTLARAYGWDEQTILQLSPLRRRFYLDALER
ncbi:MAG TPA: hypothetical protein VKR56_06845 [Candidatus Cybelea sp.]|nr:hypothetical protein [Candidatus Cybelea sp.]